MNVHLMFSRRQNSFSKMGPVPSIYIRNKEYAQYSHRGSNDEIPLGIYSKKWPTVNEK